MKKSFIVIVSLSLVSVAAFAKGMTSDYSSLKGDTCKTTELGDENGGYYTTECQGLFGYSLILDEGDSRSSLSFKLPGKEPLSVEGGIKSKLELQFQYVAGSKVEWRSSVKNGKKTPVAIIYRVAGQDASNEDVTKWKDIQFLQVAKITPTQVCVIASVRADGNENVVARQIADKKAADFVCPKED